MSIDLKDLWTRDPAHGLATIAKVSLTIDSSRICDSDHIGLLLHKHKPATAHESRRQA